MMRKTHLAALLLFALLAIVQTYPLITVLHTHFIGDSFSDAYEYAHHIWWLKYALQNGQPLFYQPLLAYPDGLSAAWVWGNPLQSFPAWLLAFVMPLPAAYNLSLLSVLTLNGWTMYLLAHKLTGSTPAALIGGAVFALLPVVQGHLTASHVGLVTLWAVPLYVRALIQLHEQPTRAAWAWGVLWFVCSLLGNNLLLVYVLFPITATLTLWHIVARRWGALVRTVSVAGVGGALALVFVAPVALEQLQSTLPPSGGDVRYSADLLAVVAPSFYNPLFSNLTYSRSVLGGTNNIEGSAYLGVIAGGLALWALWRVAAARMWGGMALGAWILSLGALLKVGGQPLTVSLSGYPTHIVLPWALLMNLPVLNISRTPARFNFAVGLAVAILAAYGAAHLWRVVPPRRRVWAWAAVPLVIAGVAFESQVWWENGLPAARTTIDLQADAITALRDDATVRAVFDMPHAHLLTAKDGMYLQTRHHKPLIAGHITRQTPVPYAKRELLQRTLNPTLLHASGADVVILHRNWQDPAANLEELGNAQLGAPFHQDARLVAWRVPTAQDAPAWVGLPAADGEFQTRAESYVFAPSTGWVRLTGALNGNGETVMLMRNNETLLTWALDGETPFDLWIPLEAGYHTLSLTRARACPQAPHPALTCRAVSVRDVALPAFDDAPPPVQVSYEGGLTLQGARLDAQNIALLWALPQPLPSDWVRFVKLLDADGVPVYEQDLAPAVTHGAWLDALTLPADLHAGEYRLYVGWYRYPSLTRLPVLTPDAIGAQDGWAQVATLTLGEP